GGLASVTLTGIEAYDTTLLSVHMVQHMVLSMVAPIFLALGAPVTLARRTLENEWVHQLVHLPFVAAGCLFFWPLLGIDPLPGRWPYPARALLMFLATPFHTVLGLTIMQSRELLGGDWYPSLELPWADPATDQRLAGGILWAGGELVSVTMLAVLVVQW